MGNKIPRKPVMKKLKTTEPKRQAPLDLNFNHADILNMDQVFTLAKATLEEDQPELLRLIKYESNLKAKIENAVPKQEPKQEPKKEPTDEPGK